MKLKKYIYDIVFLASLGLCLNFLRDPFAAADANNYISFFDGFSIFQEDLEPGLVIIRDAFGLLPFSLSPLLQYLITCLIPLAIVALTSSASRSFIPILFYLSSEVFVLLSFNGLRQGISTALLSAGFFVITTRKKNYTLTIFALLLLLLSLMTHRAALAIIGIFVLACILLSILRRVKPMLFLRAKKISTNHLIVAVVLISFVVFFFPYLQQKFLIAFLSYRESTTQTSETGILGPLWRILYCLTLFQLINRYICSPNIKYFSQAFTISGIIILILVLAGFGIGANRLTYQLPFMGTTLLALIYRDFTHLKFVQVDINYRAFKAYCILLCVIIFTVSYTSKAVQLQLI